MYTVFLSEFIMLKLFNALKNLQIYVKMFTYKSAYVLYFKAKSLSKLKPKHSFLNVNKLKDIFELFITL